MHHSTLLRNFAASCATPGHTSNCATYRVTSQHTHCRWTERPCEPSRARSAKRWPNTSPSSSWKSSSSTERRQSATSSCWLALHRLERGEAARASRRSKTPSGDGRTVSRRYSRGASRARCRSHQLRARGARDGATGRLPQQRPNTPLVSRNQAAPAAPAVAAAPE